MELTGDFRRLDGLVRAFQTLPTRAARDVSRAVAAEAEKLIAWGFATSRAPDGSPWAPLRSRRGRILVRTGRLRSSWTVSTRGLGFVITSSAPYAGYHQSGTAKMRARPMFPPGDELPERWALAFDEAAGGVLTQHFADV